MTREASESVENRRHKADAPANDALQTYRLDQQQPNRLLGNGFNLPIKDSLDIPNIWKINGNRSDSFKDNQDTRPEKASKSGQEHVVTNSDTLWRIAKESLNAGGESASNTQIAKRIQSIIKANSEEHPRLARNPHSLAPGMKLHVPDQDGHQESAKASRRSQRAEVPERRERDNSEDQRRPKERQRAGRDKPADETSEHANEGDGGKLAKAMKKFGHDLADAAIRIAERLGTIGDCAKGPRLTFKGIGFELPPAIATVQGRMLKESGLFHEVPRDEVRPGDYGVRDWNHRVAKRHGVNKGDSFIVTAVSADGALRGANDHTFNVPEDGGRYRNLRFMRPTPEFYRRYGGNI
ncbi:MAG: hypothetical protein WCT03_23915 [Candidatus Obscuribacterales bacterium]